MILRASTSLLTMAALTLSSASAQELFTESIAVREVQVPVRVLVKGEPLAGLTIEDFEIYDRGVRQKITALEVRHLGGVGKSSDPSATSAVAIGREGSRVGRSLLVLFDLGFSRRRHLGQGVEAIREMLAGQLQPQDRTAIATWGPISGLNLLVGFTADREKQSLALEAVQAMLDSKRRPQEDALRRLHRMRFGSPALPSAGSTYDVLVDELGPIAALTVLTGPVDYFAEEDAGVVRRGQESFLAPIKLRVEVDVTEPIEVLQDYVGSTEDEGMVRALGLSLAELAALLRGVGGQKDVLLLSEGFGGPLLENARSLFFLEKSFRAFRDSGWTLHSIDVGGIPGLGEESFASGSLLFMADATGGELAENFRDLSQATARLLERTEIVYVLSFEPTDEGFGGEINRLDVRLENPPRKARVIHRPGYYSPRSHAEKDSYEQRVDVAEWLLTSNLEATDLEARVTTDTRRGPDGGAATSVTVEVTAESLLAVRKKRESDFELWLTVLDRNGAVVDVQAATAQIKFRQIEEMKNFAGVRFVGDLGVPPGDYELRVLLRHFKGGEIFLASHPVVSQPRPATTGVPSPTGGEDAGAEWMIVKIGRRSAYFR